MISKKTCTSAIIGILLATVLLFASPALAEDNVSTNDESITSMKNPFYWVILGIIGAIVTIIIMAGYVWYDIRYDKLL
ncbi:hypothetical protein MsAm2_03620 [Methanolapillus ohkumae]|uniref:Uncharacterized protein n=1 Tax=Methanolapillus ohkumae TaxID=3028298 RepID=A0AA96V660_9EURY|nr:hypothetical protein MsAm2_03620 [Methanosarcinaceae archaeon Am2]